MEPEGCSTTNHRTPPIHPRGTERLRKGHSYGVAAPPMDGMIARMTPRPAKPGRKGASGVLVGLLALAVVGCGGTGPTASPAASGSGAPDASVVAPSASSSGAASPVPSASAATQSGCSDTGAAATFAPRPISSDDPNAAVFSKIESAVQTIRGITASHPVPLNLLDQAGMCAYIRQVIAQDDPPELVALTERLYKQLGLMPADESLQKVYQDLLTSQVLGRYDPKTREMYVLSTAGAVGPAQQFIYAHEFDHALQDQQFGLTSILDLANDQSDRALARNALLEGDATLLMILWAQQNLSPAELLKIIGSADPASQAALNAAPPILRETLQWPYSAGLSLTQSAYQTSASFVGVDALWKNPPDTTAQLLHPEELASRVPAVPVSFPADLARQLGPGWKVALQDTLGELQLNILMRTGNPQAGTDPAAGWAGDRVALVEGPSGAAAAIVDTTWDTATAASSAASQLGQLVTVLDGLGKHAQTYTPSAQRVVLVSADSDATLSLVAAAIGLAH